MNPNQGRIGQAILAQGLRHEYSRYNAARRSLVIASKLYSKKTRTPDESDSLANGSNAIYIDKLYSKWSKDPGSVDQVNEQVPSRILCMIIIEEFLDSPGMPTSVASLGAYCPPGSVSPRNVNGNQPQ